MKKTTPWGGTRKGAGRPIRRLTLSPDAARSVKILLLARGRRYTRQDATQIVEQLIEQAWQEYDQRLEDMEYRRERP